MNKSEQKKERPQNKHLKRNPKGSPSFNPQGRAKGSRNRSTVARELLEALSDMGKFSPKNKEALTKMGLPVKASIETLLTAAQIVKAMAGDTRAYEALMDSGYGKARQEIDHTTKGDKVTLPRLEITYTPKQ